MWRVITLLALLWPGHLSGTLDGAPLDDLAEAVLLGLVAPALIWFHPQFLRRPMARATVAAIVLLKVGAALAMQQEGWCITFKPPKPMVRDSTGNPHSWDLRADWLADDPACSAVMTRSYRDSFEVPAWFFNLPPPDDTVGRAGYDPGQIPIRIAGFGFINVRHEGTLALSTTAPMDVALRIDGTRIEPSAPGRHERVLPAGTHAVQFEGTMLSKEWRVVPEWDGAPFGWMLFPVTTLAPPSRLDLWLQPLGGWLSTLLIAALLASWLVSALRHVGTAALLIWSGASALAVSLVAISAPAQAGWYTAATIAVPLLLLTRRRCMNTRGAFLLIGVPWLAYVAFANADQVGRWTLYGIGNDNFYFQRFSYRIFMQHFWLEGGQVTFWNQPLFRWIAGTLHMLFGDSSVGQAYWDAAGVLIIAVFAYRVVASLAGFHWGVAAAALPLTMFLLGPALEFVGFGLSEISSASFIYLAVFFAMRNRGLTDGIVAGVLVLLGFYTRLNNLPMAMAVAGFALPLALPVRALWRPRALLSLVQWRVVASIAALLAIGAVLFAWRTWYYTGVFSLFHGTQRDALAVWKPGMSLMAALQAMGSSLMMVLTSHDPPRVSWYSAPLLAAAAISMAAVLGIKPFRDAPLPVVMLFAAACSGALVTRGWAYEGRFSIHLYGAASALSVWGLAAIYQQLAGLSPRRIVLVWHEGRHP